MENQAQASSQPRPQDIHIYLRNSQKKAHYIRVSKEMNHDDLRNVVSSRLRIQPEKIVMFFKGEKIESEQKVAMTEKNIVHVVNLDRVHRQWLNIHIKRLEGTKTLTHFMVESKTSIKDFINSKLYECFNQSTEQIFLVYTGKQLDINKTFLEEYVEDQSEILCVNMESSSYQVQSSAIAAKKTVNKETNRQRTPEVSGVAPIVSKQDEKEEVVTRAGITSVRKEDKAQEISLQAKTFEKEQEKQVGPFGPGKTYVNQIKKKPMPIPAHLQTAPGATSEPAIAPPNEQISTSHPKETNPEEKPEAAPVPVQAPTFIFKEQKKEESSLSSGFQKKKGDTESALRNDEGMPHIDQDRKESMNDTNFNGQGYVPSEDKNEVELRSAPLPAHPEEVPQQSNENESERRGELAYTPREDAPIQLESSPGQATPAQGQEEPVREVNVVQTERVEVPQVETQVQLQKPINSAEQLAVEQPLKFDEKEIVLESGPVSLEQMPKTVQHLEEKVDIAQEEIKAEENVEEKPVELEEAVKEDETKQEEPKSVEEEKPEENKEIQEPQREEAQETKKEETEDVKPEVQQVKQEVAIEARPQQNEAEQVKEEEPAQVEAPAEELVKEDNADIEKQQKDEEENKVEQAPEEVKHEGQYKVPENTEEQKPREEVKEQALECEDKQPQEEEVVPVQLEAHHVEVAPAEQAPVELESGRPEASPQKEQNAEENVGEEEVKEEKVAQEQVPIELESGRPEASPEKEQNVVEEVANEEKIAEEQAPVELESGKPETQPQKEQNMGENIGEEVKEEKVAEEQAPVELESGRPEASPQKEQNAGQNVGEEVKEEKVAEEQAPVELESGRPEEEVAEEQPKVENKEEAQEDIELNEAPKIQDFVEKGPEQTPAELQAGKQVTYEVHEVDKPNKQDESKVESHQQQHDEPHRSQAVEPPDHAEISEIEHNEYMRKEAEGYGEHSEGETPEGETPETDKKDVTLEQNNQPENEEKCQEQAIGQPDAVPEQVIQTQQTPIQLEAAPHVQELKEDAPIELESAPKVEADAHEQAPVELQKIPEPEQEVKAAEVEEEKVQEQIKKEEEPQRFNEGSQELAYKSDVAECPSENINPLDEANKTVSFENDRYKEPVRQSEGGQKDIIEVAQQESPVEFQPEGNAEQNVQAIAENVPEEVKEAVHPEVVVEMDPEEKQLQVEEISKPEEVENKVEEEVQNQGEIQKVGQISAGFEEQLNVQLYGASKPEEVNFTAEQQIECVELRAIPTHHVVQEVEASDLSAGRKVEEMTQNIQDNIQNGLESAPKAEDVSQKVEEAAQNIEEKVQAELESAPNAEDAVKNIQQEVEKKQEEIPSPEQVKQNVEECIQDQLESAPKVEETVQNVQQQIVNAFEQAPKPEDLLNNMEEKLNDQLENAPQVETIQEEIQNKLEEAPKPSESIEDVQQQVKDKVEEQVNQAQQKVEEIKNECTPEESPVEAVQNQVNQLVQGEAPIQLEKIPLPEDIKQINTIPEEFPGTLQSAPQQLADKVEQIQIPKVEQVNQENNEETPVFFSAAGDSPHKYAQNVLACGVTCPVVQSPEIKPLDLEGVQQNIQDNVEEIKKKIEYNVEEAHEGVQLESSPVPTAEEVAEKVQGEVGIEDTPVEVVEAQTSEDKIKEIIWADNKIESPFKGQPYCTLIEPVDPTSPVEQAAQQQAPVELHSAPKPEEIEPENQKVQQMQETVQLEVPKQDECTLTVQVDENEVGQNQPEGEVVQINEIRQFDALKQDICTLIVNVGQNAEELQPNPYELQSAPHPQQNAEKIAEEQAPISLEASPNGQEVPLTPEEIAAAAEVEESKGLFDQIKEKVNEMADKGDKNVEFEQGHINEELLQGEGHQNQTEPEVDVGADGHPINPDQVRILNNADFETLQKNKEEIERMLNPNTPADLMPRVSMPTQNECKNDESDGEFEKVAVPVPNERIEFKAGDLIYSGEMHMQETENLMGDILKDYSHLISKNQQDFDDKFGKYLPKKEEEKDL